MSVSTPYVHLFDLSAGGMGRVELALKLDGNFKRLYALKRILPEHFRADGYLAMFEDESRLAGLLHHPNVVSVLDVGNDEEGPFLAMEYVEGITVKDLVVNSSVSQLLLPIQVCCRILEQAARGLHAVHELRSHDGELLNVVHRDVSPQNILVDYEGVVRVTDFGIARSLGRETETTTGVLKGKPGYMSPEQLQFEELDRRSDIFSLGVVLYEMLTARKLYQGDADSKSRAILRDPPPDVAEIRRDIPPALQDLLLRVLAKDRESRPQDAAAVADSLVRLREELLREEDPVNVGPYVTETFGDQRALVRERIRKAIEALDDDKTTEVSKKEDHRRRRGRRPRRRPRLLVFLLGALVVVVVVSAFLFTFSSTPTTSGEEAPKIPSVLAGSSRVVTDLAPDADTTEIVFDGDSVENQIDAAPRARQKRRWRHRSKRTKSKTHAKEPSSKGPVIWSWD